MRSKDEKWIHPLALKVMQIRKVTPDEYALMGNFAFFKINNIIREWCEAGKPLLTEDAQRILDKYGEGS